MKKILLCIVLCLAFVGNADASGNWSKWCRNHHKCLISHPWVKYKNSVKARRAWVTYCNIHRQCFKKHAKLHMDGVYGNLLNNSPARPYLRDFVVTGEKYGISGTELLAISWVECNGGEADCGGAYLGCEDSSTFGSFPAQIQCSASVLARCGIGCYDPVNPSYANTVFNVMAGINVFEAVE